jgi:predicted tellurium resistance membrane protein TerC
MMMMMMMMMMMKADIIVVVILISCSFAIAGLRSLFGVLSKAVTDLKYLEKVTFSFTVVYCTITFY